MAKDKEFEKAYNLEKIRRSSLRKIKRQNNRATRRYMYGDVRYSKCPYCGGTMYWCRTCQAWSSSCCIEYGTCQCS